MPIKINGSDISIHDGFLKALTSNSDSLALSQLWLCGINKGSLRKICSTINTTIDNYEQNTWDIGLKGGIKVSDIVLNEKNWTGIAPGNATDIYLWASGVSFIADGINASRVGVSQSGATKGLISDGRLDLNATNITFLESNISFVDGMIRPWSVLVGHRSLKDPTLRCDIELFCLEKWDLYSPLKVRKSMLFKNAVPINVDAEEYNYSGDKLIQRQVQFAFDRYEMRVYPDTTSKGIADYKPAIDKKERVENQFAVSTKSDPTLWVDIKANDITMPIKSDPTLWVDMEAKDIDTSNLFGYFPPDKSKRPAYHRHENMPKGNILSLFGLLSVGKSPRYRKHKDKSNHSIIPKYDNNPTESNKNIIPSGNINNPLPNIDYIPRYDKNINTLNEAIVPTANNRPALENTNPQPVIDDNINVNDNPSISSDINSNIIDAINILPFNLNLDKPNISPVPIANIISTGQ